MLHEKEVCGSAKMKLPTLTNALSLWGIVMTFFILHFKIHENSLKFAKKSIKFANFKVQNEECHYYALGVESWGVPNLCSKFGQPNFDKIGPFFNGRKCLEKHYNKVGLHSQITNKDM
jgi:hypothetical protein